MNQAARNSSSRISKVAVIGRACRLPGGANTPDQFFGNLLEGGMYVGDVPEDRWSVERFTNARDTPGKAYVGRGHFLHDYDFKTFDPEFFGFSPREVEFIDPQQRLLLELAWEALEDAGVDVEAMSGSATGVFVGGFTLDHLLNQFGSTARDAIGSHSAAGATLTMLSNRISYAFDFCGPSLSIDTACSSSLVALSQAVGAILSGQCEAALVGGVNFILRPEYMIAMAKGRFLAKDGRSKSFDARADGYGRGEGGAMVVLKSHEAALRDGDRILAVIDGAGVNQDGRTSGITVPNPEAQRALMLQVLQASGLRPIDIGYVEAHGTGTQVGDGRESSAIANVYADEAPCLVGSVKANVGHLEAGAGVTSVVKAVEMLRSGLVPPIAGLETVNPEIPSNIELPRSPVPLVRRSDDADAPLRVAINSFGYGGTNAHVILAAPANEVAAPDDIDFAASGVAPSVPTLPLSARSREALTARASQIAARLETAKDGELSDLLYTAGARRTHLSHRLAVWGEDRAALASQLRAFVAGEAFAGADGERPLGGSPRIAFVYTGMGPQWWGMGRQLFHENAAFATAVEEADVLFQQIAGFSILEEMLKDEDQSQIKRTEYAQPGNLMVQIGLTAALKAEGIVPDAVVGHSVGEVASAWASGMLSLEHALLVSRERSRIQATTAGTGAMLALGMSRDEAEKAIAPHGGLVSLAALNSPMGVTVAGDRAALEAIRVKALEQGTFARMLDVEVPYHSPLMEPLKPALRTSLAPLAPQPTSLPLYSTVTGDLIDRSGRGFDAEYWCDNVREPVFFADAVAAMMDDGYTLFVEVGPHPVLRRSITETASVAGRDIRAVSTLWMEQPETPALRRAVCDIYTAGGTVDWAGRVPQGRQVTLPAYPWQRQHLWREMSVQSTDRCLDQEAPLSADGHPIDLTGRRLNYFADHMVDGAPIMPAAGYLETLCEEARRRWPDARGYSLHDVQIRTALVLDANRALRLDIKVDPLTGRAQLHSFDTAEPQKTVFHAEAMLHPYRAVPPQPAIIALGNQEGTQTLTPEELYQGFAERALGYGPAFQPIVDLRRNRAERLVEARLTRPEQAGEPAAAYILHPALLDGCFQAALALLDVAEGAYLPVSIATLEVYGSLPEDLLCRAHLTSLTAAAIICDFELFDPETGRMLARIEGLTCRSLRGKAVADRLPAGDYQRQWRLLPAIAPKVASEHDGALLIVTDHGDPLAEALAAAASNHGLTVHHRNWGEVENGCLPAKVGRVVGLSNAGMDEASDITGETTLVAMLEGVKLLAAQERSLPLRVVTCRAHAVLTGDEVIPAQTAIASFLRVVRNEQPLLNAATIDTDGIENGATIAAILAEVLADDIDEVALRGGDRYGARMVRSEQLRTPDQFTANAADEDAMALDRSHPIPAMVAIPALAAGPGEYILRAERLSLRAGHGEAMMGVVGTVCAAGDGVTRYAIGDRVAGLVPQQVAGRIVVRESEAVLEQVPHDGPMLAAAATMFARCHALAAATGLGHDARALVTLGAFGDSFAEALAERGVEVTRMAADRSGDMPVTRGRPFDALAMPLATWSREAGFSHLARGGQLIDLADTPAAFILPEHCSRLLRLPTDLHALMLDDAYHAALATVVSQPLGKIPGLAQVGWADLLEAETLGDEDNGWVEVDVAGDERPIAVDRADIPELHRAGTYLITGGLGGLGQELALWLAEHGAGHVALVGRRGMATPGAKQLVQRLTQLGAAASVHAADMTDADAVQALLVKLNTTEQPLRGIYHAAGVLEDRLVTDMSADDLVRVLRPKALGAWTLHAASVAANLPLDHFLLFSSIANLVGNSRQANYCAANGFLDGLAALRRRQGLPAISIHFGAIAGTGMLAEDERVGQHLTQIGLAPLEVDVALRGVGRALAKDLAAIAVAEEIAWDRWAGYEQVGGRSPCFAELVEASRASRGGDASLVEELQAAVAQMDDASAHDLLKGLIAEIVARGLKSSVERLNVNQSFDALGVDSLMSIEIQLLLEETLGVGYSVVELLGPVTVTALTDKALIAIRESVAANEASPAELVA